MIFIITEIVCLPTGTSSALRKKKKGKESQFGLALLFRLGEGWGCDIIDYHLEKENIVVDALSRKIIFTLSLKYCDWRFDYDGALLAQLRVIPYLKQMIIDAQKNDKEMKKKV